MDLQFCQDGVRQNGEAVILAPSTGSVHRFAGADDDLVIAKVYVPSTTLRAGFDAQAQAFVEAQAAAIQDFGHQARSAAHLINDRQGFGMGQYCGQDLRAGSAHQCGGQVDLFLQDDAI